jgi:hypothetical protein
MAIRTAAEPFMAQHRKAGKEPSSMTKGRRRADRTLPWRPPFTGRPQGNPNVKGRSAKSAPSALVEVCCALPIRREIHMRLPTGRPRGASVRQHGMDTRAFARAPPLFVPAANRNRGGTLPDRGCLPPVPPHPRCQKERIERSCTRDCPAASATRRTTLLARGDRSGAMARGAVRDARHNKFFGGPLTLPQLHHKARCFRSLLRLFAGHFRRMPFVARCRAVCIIEVCLCRHDRAELVVYEM